MRKITMWLMSTVAVLVLLFSYRTSTGGGAATAAVATAPAVPGGTDSTGSPGSAGSDDDGGSGATGSGSTGSGSGADKSDKPATGSGAAKTYTGSVASTRWGDVQVTVTMAGGKITDVQVPVYPTGNHRDEEINAYALPILRQATLAAQSADIDSVSGATVTSDGYRESLQSALDAAR